MRLVIVRREPGVALSMDTYTDNLVTELKRLRPTWKITEIAPQPWSHCQKNLWGSGTGIRKYYERLWNHPRQVCKVDGDIYHIIDHSNAHVTYWLKSIDKPIVVTCHDLVQFVYPEILKGLSRFAALSMASWQYSVKGMRCASRIVAVSSNTAQDAQHFLGLKAHQITVVPNGVEASFRRLPLAEIQPFRQQHQRSPNEICLLNVGSTHQRKNILTVLRVLKALKEQKIPARLWRLGDSFTADQMAFIQANNLASDILDFGKPDKAAVIQLYNAADVLIAPSLYEGFGLTVLEAMACGLPVITSNVSSLPEVVGNAAIMVEPLNVQAIVEATLKLYQETIFRQEYVNRGLRRAKELNWRKAAESLISIYEQLVDQRQTVSAIATCSQRKRR